MLERLRIVGYAIIDELEIEFDDGLCILTGETGAGKSILIGALGLILGQKADASMIRAGAHEATVSGVIVVEGAPAALEWLAQHDLAPEDGSVIIRRVVKESGRGSMTIQSEPIPRAEVAEFTSLLIDVHGQHEHQSLLRRSTQRELVDRYAGIEDEVAAFRTVFSQLSEKREQLEELATNEAEQLRLKDVNAFAVQEIDAADLNPGEEEELSEEIKVLSRAEQLYTSMQEFHSSLAENRGGALASMRRALGELSEIASIVESLKPLSERLESAFFEVEDITSSMREYQDGVDFSPERLDACETRLAEIHRLEKKYGASIPDVLSYRDEARQSVDRMENLDEEKQRIREEIATLERQLRSDAESLSAKRMAASKRLEAEITGHLSHLGMEKATFSIRLERRERQDGRPVYTQYGIDAPEFLIAANAGEPPKPLSRIASGGEMSRIMLALKTVLASSDDICTLVFDEIDAGIGGQVAVSVGEHLAGLSLSKQVLCITHLSTIAVQADQHLAIRKRSIDGRTTTQVESLGADDRVSEIARMLSGDPGAEVSRSHAKELLAAARNRNEA